MMYLITGKAGAGKTHYAKQLCAELKEAGELVVWIDGDVFRAKNKNKDFSEAGRVNNLMEASILGKEYADKGYNVVMSFIAPMKAYRAMMRLYFKESITIYIPGGSLWEGTTYEKPTFDELTVIRKE